MTMLEIIQSFCRRTNITVPTSVIGTSDQQILQLYSILEEEIDELSGRGSWQYLTYEATHTTVATESQGSIDDIATNNFRFIKNDTIWDRTENLPVIIIDGPDWQAEKGFSATSPRYRARIRTNQLISTPVPSAGNTWAFEYVTWNAILDNDGTTTKQVFSEDTDTLLLPDTIVKMGLRWRWKKEKGFEYAEDFRTYETMVADALGREGMKTVLHQDRSERRTTPKVVVNQGNWPL